MEVNAMKSKAMIPILLILILAIAGGSAYYFLVLRNTDTKTETKTYTYSIDDSFITNVKNSSKLFKTTIVLVSNSDKLDDLLSQKEYVVRDTILFLLRDLTEADITKEDIQDTLRTKIADALNQALGIDNITSVYFGDFVMQ